MEEAQIVLDLEASLQHQLDTLYGNANEAENFTIFRIPHNIFQSKKNLFEPAVISIAPFHHGQKHLQALEELKRRFLRDFLSRGDHITLNRCISEMKLLETRTRRCYSETFDDFDSHAFVEMMLLDGCFLVEYFLKIKQQNWNSIREVSWNTHFIVHDLLLQENQIPFFIVDKLYELIGHNQDARKFYAIYLARNLSPTNSIISNPPAEIHHLLHLCYHYLVPNPEEPVVLSSKPFDLTRMFSTNRIIKGLLHWFRSRPVRRGRLPHPNSTENPTGDISLKVIPSATELKQKGLKFAQQSNPRHMLDISFEYGILKIPRLKIFDCTKILFANLLAFEHSKYRKENSPFGRFVEFLDRLVNTPNDVTILQEYGIIENFLGSEEEVAHFLNQVTEGIVLSYDHYLAELYTEVNRYSESSWNKQRAKLIRDYFSILVVLTLVQSFFAVFTYFRPTSP